MHLRRVSCLETNGVSDKPAASETEEWWENVQVEGQTIQCQLDTSAYASVINTIQLQKIATKATIKPTSQTFVSYSQHRITQIGLSVLQ